MLEAGETDRQLLDHFVHGQDAGAFQSLVLRHGAAVNRVCRGVLNDPHEAEDVFQATFLVLARRAPDIRDPDALEGWLRGVARRIALRARRRAARRSETEKTRAEMSRERPVYSPADGTFDLREIVGSELNRLPDDYRRPIVLCYLDGLTHQEAARRLQWPLGTVKIRLTRGRQMLKERLDRRGVALGAGLLTLLPKGQAAPAVSPALVDRSGACHVARGEGSYRDTPVGICPRVGDGPADIGCPSRPRISLDLGRLDGRRHLAARLGGRPSSVRRISLARSGCLDLARQFDRRPECRVPLTPSIPPDPRPDCIGSLTLL